MGHGRLGRLGPSRMVFWNQDVDSNFWNLKRLKCRMSPTGKVNLGSSALLGHFAAGRQGNKEGLDWSECELVYFN